MSHLTVIAGSMYAGKSEELVMQLRRYRYRKKRILVVKPKIDTRTKEEIVSRLSHTGKKQDFTPVSSWEAISIESAKEFSKLIKDYNPEVVGIDEAQFFKPWMFSFINKLLAEKSSEDLKILIAGLDMDAWRRPFGIMPNLMAIADEVIKKSAVCMSCDADAVLSQKIVKSGQQVEVGNTETYEARCRKCHVLPEEL